MTRKGVAVAEKIRLNFSIDTGTDRVLESYCADLGRHKTEVLRQLLIEFVDGDRALRGEVVEPQGGRRLSILVSQSVLTSLDAASGCYGVSKAAIMSNLLMMFLLARSVRRAVSSDVRKPDEGAIYRSALERLLEAIETGMGQDEAVVFGKSVLGCVEEEMQRGS